MSSETDKVPLASKVAFRLGQFIFLIGFILYAIGISSSHWVDRPVVDLTAKGVTTKATLHYGIFIACLQISDSGRVGNCSALWENLVYIDAHTARFVQALTVIACILFFIGFILEIYQLLPIRYYRNFIAQNRMVELFSGIAAVIALGAIVVFAGEIKNKAERVNGQDEEVAGWSFVLAVIGLGLSMLGIMTIIMFRELPVPKAGEKGGSWMRF